MPKKCIICGQEAQFCIRDCSEFYCEECAQEHFADMGMLEKVEERTVKMQAAPAPDEIEEPSNM